MQFSIVRFFFGIYYNINAQSSLSFPPDQPIIVNKFKYSRILCQLKCKYYIMNNDYPTYDSLLSASCS